MNSVIISQARDKLCHGLRLPSRSSLKYIFSKSEPMWVQFALDLWWIYTVLDPLKLLANTDFRATRYCSGPKFEFCNSLLCYSRRLSSWSLSLCCTAFRKAHVWRTRKDFRILFLKTWWVNLILYSLTQIFPALARREDYENSSILRSE